MNKREFLKKLKKGISSLPRREIEEQLHFYSEMIDDRMEEGISEDDAVSAVGSVEEIAAEILSTGEDAKARPMKRLEILLLILGTPVWIPLLISFFALIFSVYISLWAAVISLWAVFASLIGCMIGGICGGVICSIFGNALPGIALVGGGIVCAGLAIFAFFGCKCATVATVRLAKRSVTCVKGWFSKKGAE